MNAEVGYKTPLPIPSPVKTIAPEMLFFGSRGLIYNAGNLAESAGADMRCQRRTRAQTSSCGRDVSGQSMWKNFPRG